MEVAVDAYLAVPLLFTLLAVLVASLYLKFRASDSSTKDEAASSKVDDEKPKSEAEDERKPEGVSEESGAGEPEQAKGKLVVEDVGAADSKAQGEQEPAAPQDKGSQVKQEPTRPEEKRNKEGEEEVEGTKKCSEEGAETESPKTSLPDDVTDDLVDEYRPGKVQRSSYEKTLTKEQLEEEQRIQQGQLAAIFKLMKERKEDFGDMSEGDMEEQLKLYSL